MKFFKSALHDGRVRILDENKNAIILKFFDNNARIMTVPENYDLVKAAQTLAISQNVKRINFDYKSDLTSLEEQLQEDGFKISNSVNILSVSATDLFASKGVKKSIDIDFPDVEYIPFRDLILYQAQEAIDLLSKEKIIIGDNDIDRFDEDLSCIVYDEARRPKSIILASTQGKEIVIELLFSMAGSNPKFVMAATQGFARELLSLRLLEVYDRISMLEVNDSITPLIKRLLDKEYSLDITGEVHSASKELSESSESADIEFEDVPLGLFVDEKIGYPYQNNINIKSQWKLDSENNRRKF